MNPAHRCPLPDCRQPMHDYEQESLVPGRPAIPLSECRNPACKLYLVTLTTSTHEQLTEDQIAAYVSASSNSIRP